MSKITGYHVRHDLRPNLARELLQILQVQQNECSEDDIKQTAIAHGSELRKRKSCAKLLRSFQELEIVSQNNGKYKLEERGKIIANLSIYYPYLFPELIHFLYITSWDHDNNKRFSWSYKTVCSILWQSAPGNVNRDYLVTYVIQQAQKQFSVDTISFSKSSVAGILNWIEELQPTCMSGDENLSYFKLRPYCPVELFILALHQVWNNDHDRINYVPISDDLRRRVCQICLIPIESFPTMLEQAQDCFPILHVRRERGERFSLKHFSWEILLEN